ncbi:testis-expressed protein 10 homolog [Manduca sexta]|uniref:Pre-rRNA-processing protein Ipi1 N-terminal domain-containing protein n=1 Tax=Manduca sexta TaxID=7130 RepID=A0A921YWB5_MANSE|nr:testis-expressed protein 10 homolog [Manduca sexta]KAG6446034.1 hypothetical protein O3G_MSEX004217 [Manduca sexta]
MPKTGATRYQKFLKSEKAKTKLKAKKDLPKGTNVTKTNFKVKKIVIKEQLKKHEVTEALSTRKLNVKELLSRLNHFNTNTRTEALKDLMELVTVHPNVLDRNLGQLVLGITPLILNVEKVLRRESVKVLHIILSHASINNIDPFFDIISTYLRSAMTHIDNRIQEDSLLFLDILLSCTPRNVAQHFHKIMPNFLDMISKLRVDSKPGRTLTVNMGSQITSVKWRVKVLYRLQDYLDKFVHHNNMHETEKPVAVKTHIFDKTKLNHCKLFNPSYVSVCHLSCFSSKKSQEVEPIDEVAKFLEYIDTLMPLLFETWLEVCPNINSEKNFETVINEDGASLLKHILKVVCLLWQLIKYLSRKNPSSNMQTIFCQKYRQQFTQYFLNLFPYVTNTRLKAKSEGSEFGSSITDPKLVAENLEICNLFILMNPNVNMKSHNKEIVSVLNYIEKMFGQNTQEETNDIVIRVMHSIFSNEINSWTRSTSIMDSLFRKIVWTYFNKTSGLFKQQIFSLLCKISLNDKLGHFHNIDAHGMWLKNLPDILLGDSITVQTIDILHKFAVRNNNIFNSVIKPKLIMIVKNLPNIVISDAPNDTCSYHKLFSLLFWIKPWDGESLNLLEHQLLNNAYQSDHSKFILDTLKLRIGGVE